MPRTADPRFVTAREGQVDFREVPPAEQEWPWSRWIISPIGARLKDGVSRREAYPFKPYRWRDPSRRPDPRLANLTEDD